MNLLFVRHGESEANVLRQISNRGLRHPLTERGRRQVELLAASLAFEPVAHIYSSPLLRAIESAEILGRMLDAPHSLTDALREYDCGVIEGRADDEAWALHAELQRRWYEEGDHSARYEGGESFEDIESRFVPFIHGLLAEYRWSEDSVILVGHGGTYRAMLPLVVENLDPETARTRPMPNACPIVTVDNGGVLVCTSWPETGALV